MASAHAEAPGKRVEVWAFDEHRLGLKPLSRRVWASWLVISRAEFWYRGIVSV
ncbi:MAG: hypothetical protein O3C34_01810 [Proteobacteria bacterium]|nr:hypothetical protein [Pseudomonadota bacterium]